MYKGKFDQKSRQSGADVKELLAQREQDNAVRAAKTSARPSAPQSGAKRPAPQNPQRPASRPAAAQNGPQAQKRPAPAPVPAAPQKRGPRLGSVIFYTLYFMFILVFFAATFLGLNWLKGWLADYEASQPTVKAEQVFTQLFSDPDWASLYEAAGAADSPYEGKEEFVTYMEGKVGDNSLTYLETSAGLSGDKKYIVRCGDEKVATFTLTDKNNVSSPSFENLENLEDLGEITKIADWQLGSVEVFFQRNESYRIVKMNGHKALVNGVELNDDFTIQIATTMAEEYLPEGTTMTSMCTQEITNLFALPTVTVFDEDGNEAEVTYDTDTKTFTERTSGNTMTPDQEEAVRSAATTYCKWMIKEVTSRDTVAKYFDKNTDAYSNIVKTTELWMQSHNGFKFEDEKITGFAQYGNDLFSVRISMTLNVTRTNGTVKAYPYASSMVFRKTDGKWLCIRTTNVDITQPVGKVRLTFMNDETEILSKFFETDAKQIVTPTISPIPEGKVFAGWVRKDTDASGVTTLSVVFQPDEGGNVTIPEGAGLEPMTLYAYYEDAAAQAAPAEAVPETTEGAA